MYGIKRYSKKSYYSGRKQLEEIRQEMEVQQVSTGR